jgi:hypothetical protein
LKLFNVQCSITNIPARRQAGNIEQKIRNEKVKSGQRYLGMDTA